MRFSSGKFWVMRGKWFDRTVGPAQTQRAEDVFGADGFERSHLVLMKCAVICCEAPVYSIHVSPLHLFLGENSGIRVWNLRPLIKSTFSGRSCSKLQSRPRSASDQSSYQSSEKLDCDLFEHGERCRHDLESGKAFEKLDANKSASNSIHSKANAKAWDLIVDTAMKDSVKIGLPSYRERNVAGGISGIRTHRQSKIGPGSYTRVKEFEFRSLSDLQVSLKMDLSLAPSPVEDDISEKATLENSKSLL